MLLTEFKISFSHINFFTVNEFYILNNAHYCTMNTGSGGSSKTKAAAKLRVQTSRIVSSFKTSPVQCRLSKQYTGHRDGVWDVDTIHRDVLLLATASAGMIVLLSLIHQ